MNRTGIALLAGSLLVGAAAAMSPTSAQSPATSSTPDPPLAATLPSGTAVNAELNSYLDSKKAKVGDRVEAHTTAAVTIAGKTIVPRGAKLEGHVTEATARSKGDGDSKLAIRFDEAIPKKGEEIPLNVLIMAVAQPQRPLYEAAPGPANDAMADRGAAAAGGSPMGASRAPNPGTETPGYPSASSTAPEPTMETAGSGQLPANTRGVYGLKDLKLMETKSEAGATTFLTSPGKEIRLDGGTRLLLIAQPGSAATVPSQ